MMRLITSCLVSMGLLALAVSPVAAQTGQRGEPALFAEVNECNLATSFVCVELWVYENPAVPGGVYLSYYVRDLNYATEYVAPTNLYGIPRAMFTVDQRGRHAELFVPAGTVVYDYDGYAFTVPGDIWISWQAEGKDRTELDVISKRFSGPHVTRTSTATIYRPAIATGVLLGFPVDSRNGWPDCCREPGRITEIFYTESYR